MKKVVWATISILISIVVIATAAYLYRGEEVKVSDYLPDGFTAYEFPRADMGPGTVFVGERSDDGIVLETVICDSLYLAEEPIVVDVPIALPNIEGSSDNSASGVVSFLSGSLGVDTTASRNDVFSIDSQLSGLKPPHSCGKETLWACEACFKGWL